MRYTSALVLGTLAVAEATVHNVRHVGFHARRQAGGKRSEIDYDAAMKEVDWKAVSYDFSSVDWSKVDYGNGKPAPSTTTSSVEEKKPEPTSTYAPAPTSSPATTTSESAPEPEQTKGSSGDVDLSSLIDSALSTCKKLNFLEAINSETPTANMWLGGSSDWQAEFTNDGDETVTLFCWDSSAFTNMYMEKVAAPISIDIPVGGSQVISYAPGVAFACAPVWSDTTRNSWGQVYNTWLEGNMGTKEGKMGVFDVSREVKAYGNSISAKGKKCSSTMDVCVFKCKDSSAEYCGEAGTYDLYNCDASNGGGGGYNAEAKGTGGGCNMPSDGEYLQVTLSK